MRRNDMAYQALLWLGNALLLFFLCVAAGAVMGGGAAEIWRQGVCFLPILPALPLTALLRTRLTGPGLLLGLPVCFLLCAGGCLWALSGAGLLTVLSVVEALAVSLAAVLLLGLGGAELELPRTLAGCALAALLLFARSSGPVWEQGLLGALSGLFLLTGLCALSGNALRMDSTVSLTPALRRGASRLTGLFLAALGVLTALLSALFLLLRPLFPAPVEAPHASDVPQESLQQYLERHDGYNMDPKLVRKVVMSVLIFILVFLLFQYGKKLLRRVMRSAGKSLPWRSPPPESGETVSSWRQEEGFGRWLRRKLRQAAGALRPREKLNPAAPPRDQIRFVYRAILRERVPTQPELLRRTPEEVMPQVEKDGAQAFAPLYNQARYSDEPLDPGAAEKARLLYQLLQKKRKK